MEGKVSKVLNHFKQILKQFDKKVTDVPNSPDNLLMRRYYKFAVKLMRETNTAEHFYNHFPWQTEIVFDNLLGYAHEYMDRNKPDNATLRIFSSDTELNFLTTEKLDSIVDLNKKGCKLNIILASPPKKNKLEIWKKYNDLLDKQSIRMFKHYDETKNHLWLFENAYRWEKNHEDYTGKLRDEVSPERPAQFAFNNEVEAGRIKEYFRKQIEPYSFSLA